MPSCRWSKKREKWKKNSKTPILCKPEHIARKTKQNSTITWTRKYEKCEKRYCRGASVKFLEIREKSDSGIQGVNDWTWTNLVSLSWTEFLGSHRNLRNLIEFGKNLRNLIKIFGITWKSFRESFLNPWNLSESIKNPYQNSESTDSPLGGIEKIHRYTKKY